MRVKARLSSAAIDYPSIPPADPARDPDFRALAVLFPDDPLVARDVRGWYFSASALDRADTDGDAGELRDTTDRMVAAMNGSARLLRSDAHVSPIHATYEYDGREQQTNSARLFSVAVYSTRIDDLDPDSAISLVKLSEREPRLRRILDLLQHMDREWVWFDLWRIWDVIGGHFRSRQAFNEWGATWDPDFAINSVRFGNSANDPGLGDNRRHAMPDYRHRSVNGKVPPPMTVDEAVAFIRKLTLRWIEHHFDVKLRPQS